jgi:hypothetical protein
MQNYMDLFQYMLRNRIVMVSGFINDKVRSSSFLKAFLWWTKLLRSLAISTTLCKAVSIVVVLYF